MSKEKCFSAECPKCYGNVEITIKGNMILIRKDCKCEVNVMDLIK